MQFIQSFLNLLTETLQPYMAEIALTIVATTLVVYGDVLNKQLKQILKPYPFVIRTLAFVLVCAFGYGLLIVFLTPHIKQLLLWIPSLYRGAAVVGLFILIGYLAEHRRYI